MKAEIVIAALYLHFAKLVLQCLHSCGLRVHALMFEPVSSVCTGRHVVLVTTQDL